MLTYTKPYLAVAGLELLSTLQATEGLPDMYKTIAYVDHDNLAASEFKARNPDVPQWRDIGDIMQPEEFDATADVAFVGTPCGDHSVLNPDRQPDSEHGRLIFKALTKVQQLFTKVGVFEVVDGFLSTPQFGQFCAEAAPTHTVIPVRMNPLDYGGYKRETDGTYFYSDMMWWKHVVLFSCLSGV